MYHTQKLCILKSKKDLVLIMITIYISHIRGVCMVCVCYTFINVIIFYHKHTQYTTWRFLLYQLLYRCLIHLLITYNDNEMLQQKKKWKFPCQSQITVKEDDKKNFLFNTHISLLSVRCDYICVHDKQWFK